MSKRFLIRWLLISLGLHLAAAIFSIGYQNSDEHFQILEFLNTILGGTPASSLPIEYAHQIRPWFQPFLYWLPVRFFMLFGIQNPFIWAFSIRALSSLIGWFSMVSLALCVPLWIQEIRWQKATVIALSLFWCLPALHARHSSENLSGALFVIGLCWILKFIHGAKSDRPVPPIVFSGLGLAGLGMIWGFAFEARYQVGFMVAGGFLWLAFVAKLRLRDLALLFSGILLAIGVGTYLDFLGYGRCTFAPWNYFHFNLIQDYVSSTDVSPWWDYFRRSWTESWPILGFLTLMSLILFWIRKPWHVLTWSFAPLFLVHFAIGHKETRFLFPLINVAPVCLMLLIHAKTPPRWISRSMIALNGIALVTLTLVPAAPTMRFYKSVYERSIRELRFIPPENPYTVLGIPMYFYRPTELQLIPLESPAPSQEFWLAIPSAELGSKYSPDLSSRCEAVTHSIPAISGFNPLSRLRNWTLYRCNAI